MTSAGALEMVGISHDTAQVVDWVWVSCEAYVRIDSGQREALPGVPPHKQESPPLCVDTLYDLTGTIQFHGSGWPL